MPTTEAKIAVVGAGLAGLTLASELAQDTSALVIDRLPMYGGVLGYEHPLVRTWARRCEAVRVEFHLATTATRWEGHRVLLVGPTGIRWTPATRLLIATGTRPSTQAEMGISGERLAGVLPAPVAIHLAEAEVTLGHRVAVVGWGNWANRTLEAIRHHGAHTACIPLSDAPGVADGFDESWPGWYPVRVEGRSRVERLILAKDGAEHVIECDAVILAAKPRPLRNVDGAIWPDSPSATFIQPVAESLTAEEVIEAAKKAAAELGSRAALGSR